MNGLVMLCLWAGAAMVIVLIAGWSKAAEWANANSPLSSWVQAVGSVAAIGLAVWVVQRQHRLELRRQALADWQAKRVALQGALQAMSGVYRVAEKIANISRHRPPVRMDLFHLTIELEVLVNALSRTDYLRFETHVAIEGLVVTETLGRSLLRIAEDGLEHMKFGAQDHWGGIISMANSCMTAVKARTDGLFADISAMKPPG